MIGKLEHHTQVFCSSYFFISSPYTPILQVHKAYISKYKNKVTNLCAEKYVNFEI